MQNKHPAKRLLIGVTGGIGSGKSLACKYLEEYGFNVFYADDITKQLYDTKALKAKLTDELGISILENGKISLPVLRELVFGNKKNQQRVNKIVHPFVINEILSLAEKSESAIIIIEAALIFESGFDEYLDYVINISASPKLRIGRVSQRSDMTVSKIKSVMALQMDDDERRKKSDFDIKNEGNTEDFKKQVLFIANIVKNLS